MTTVTSSDFVAQCRSYLGTPWKHQGRLPSVALDCAGMVVCAATALGIEVADDLAYGRRPDTAVLQGCIRRSGLVLVPRHELRAGDLLVMSYDANPQHLAVISEPSIDGLPPKVIHSAASYRKVCEHFLDPSWRGRVVHAWRFPLADTPIT